MRGLIPLAGLPLAACAADDPCAATRLLGGDRSVLTRLADGTSVHLLLPAGAGRYADGSPAVVFVRGGWNQTSVPATTLPVRFGSGRGVAQVYLDLPDDLRGAESRAAVAAALWYAAGAAEDADGCTIESRLGGPLSGQRVLAGYSNGGNLAWSTLADPALELPPVDGVVTFESPASSQLVLLDVYARYQSGSCALTDGNALSCDIRYDGMALDLDAGLFLDRDGDGALDADSEPVLGTLEDSETGAVYHSTEASAAAESLGLIAAGSAEAAAAFWSWREAPQAMQAARERHPGLATIVAATTHDHVLAGLGDWPHVTGMMAAAEAAGLRWHRLNPDASYTVLETGDAASSIEHDAGLAWAVSDTPVLLPESSGAGRGVLTAGVLELLDRTHEDVWEADLDGVLFRR